MSRRHLPADHAAVAPYFLVEDASGFITFLTQAFAAVERQRLTRPDGVIQHAELMIDGSIIMLATRDRPVANSTHLYVPDVDEVYHRCLELGAQSISAPTTYPYGDRSAGIRDPQGNVWWLGTHLGEAASR